MSSLTVNRIRGGTWVLTLVFFVASSFFVFSSSARTHRRGLVEEPPRVEPLLLRGKSVSSCQMVPVCAPGLISSSGVSEIMCSFVDGNELEALGEDLDFFVGWCD